MVKNTKGGTGTKSLARKHQNNSATGKIRLPECELEVFAYVAKMYGNGMCEIITNDNTKLIGHIRNKFKGRHKRHNTIMINMIVLVGLREWESTPKNCDILYIYDDAHIKLIHDMPSYDISSLLANTNSQYNQNNHHNNHNNNIDFDFISNNNNNYNNNYNLFPTHTDTDTDTDTHTDTHTLSISHNIHDI